jgi:hypothetical protein
LHLQGNLKWIAGHDQAVPLFDELQLAADLHTQIEHWSLQQRLDTWSLLTSCSVQQSHLHSLRTLPVSLVVGAGCAQLLLCCTAAACTELPTSCMHSRPLPRPDEVLPNMGPPFP